MKTFYSAEDIENFADRGQREIRVDDNVVLTDMAKQTAHILGIRLTDKSSGALPDNLTPAGRQSGWHPRPRRPVRSTSSTRPPTPWT